MSTSETPSFVPNFTKRALESLCETKIFKLFLITTLLSQESIPQEDRLLRPKFLIKILEDPSTVPNFTRILNFYIGPPAVPSFVLQFFKKASEVISWDPNFLIRTSRSLLFVPNFTKRTLRPLFESKISVSVL